MYKYTKKSFQGSVEIFGEPLFFHDWSKLIKNVTRTASTCILSDTGKKKPFSNFESLNITCKESLTPCQGFFNY